MTVPAGVALSTHALGEQNTRAIRTTPGWRPWGLDYRVPLASTAGPAQSSTIPNPESRLMRSCCTAALLCVACAVTLPAQQDRWRSLGDDTKGGKWALDSETLHRKGHIVTFWVRVVPLWPQLDTSTAGVRSFTRVLAHYRADCEDLSVEVLSSERRSTDGDLVSSFPGSASDAASPGSMREVAMRAACRATAGP